MEQIVYDPARAWIVYGVQQGIATLRRKAKECYPCEDVADALEKMLKVALEAIDAEFEPKDVANAV